MINLLPPELKQNYHYARRNTWLLNWVVLFGLVLFGLAMITLVGWFYLRQTTVAYTAQVAQTQRSLDAQKQRQTETQIKDMSSSLRLAVQVLSKEVLFSQLLKQMAVVTPANVTLSNLNISQGQGSVDITARAIDYQSATQLHANLADPDNKIFAKADIVSITCATGAGAGAYPCTVVVRALFATNNPFLFINNKKAGP